MMKTKHPITSPYRNLFIVFILIVVSEILCHFVVDAFFPEKTKSMLLLIDSGLLLLMIIPSLYFFVYKPKNDMLKALMAAQKTNENLALIIANSSIMLFSLRVKGEPKINTEWASENAKKILGYSEAEIHAPDWWFENIHPQDQSEIITQSSMLFEGHKEHFTYEYRFRHKNGDYIWIHDEQRLEFDEQGNLSNILCIWKDVTENKMLEMELTIAAHTFGSREGIMITDADQRILKVNETFEKITGRAPEEVIGHTPAILKSGKHDADFYKTMKEQIHIYGYWQGEIWNKRKSGEVYPEQLTITAIKDRSEKVTNYIGTFSDITERKAEEEKTRLAAYYDLLTSLPNRRLLIDRLERIITANTRSKQSAALLFLDVDRFKILNDTYGHDMGDQFLMKISERLKLCVRESDTLSRFGGDEFVILLTALNENMTEAVEQAQQVAGKVRKILAEPYKLINKINGNTSLITHISSASIGVVLFSGDDAKADELLKQADLAMYEAKTSGGDSICVYELTTDTFENSVENE